MYRHNFIIIYYYDIHYNKPQQSGGKIKKIQLKKISKKNYIYIWYNICIWYERERKKERVCGTWTTANISKYQTA